MQGFPLSSRMGTRRGACYCRLWAHLSRDSMGFRVVPGKSVIKQSAGSPRDTIDYLLGHASHRLEPRDSESPGIR